MIRHWFSEAKKVDFPETEMQSIIDQTINNVDSVIANVSSRIPEDFPSEINEPIFNGINKLIKKLKH